MPRADDTTYTVSQLGGELRELLGEVYRSLWVEGEVERPHATARGHLFFELVEKGAGDRIVGKIDAVLWHTDHLRVARELRAEGLRLETGHAIRCRGQIDYYGPAGRLQLVVRDVDPLFALGQLARRRRETVAALEAAGLLDANRSRPLSPLPLRIALVTSAGSAAYHDFLAGLAASSYGFQVTAASSVVQGHGAEAELERTLERLGRLAEADPERFDAVVLIRGGGARSDLAAFDSRGVAEAVARCPLPVLTGLGHEIDRSVADLVAYRAFKTPSDVATFLVDRLLAADSRLSELGLAMAHISRMRLAAARGALLRASQAARLARSRITDASRHLGQITRQLDRSAGRRLSIATRRVEEMVERVCSSARNGIGRNRPRAGNTARRIAERSQARLAVANALVDGRLRLCTQLAPSRTLARGFSITRDIEGRAIRHPDQTRTGSVLVTELAEGRIHSRVAEDPDA